MQLFTLFLNPSLLSTIFDMELVTTHTITEIDNLSSKEKLDILLMGSINLTYDKNKSLFFAVQKYILNTKRFTT